MMLRVGRKIEDRRHTHKALPCSRPMEPLAQQISITRFEDRNAVDRQAIVTVLNVCLLQALAILPDSLPAHADEPAQTSLP